MTQTPNDPPSSAADDASDVSGPEPVSHSAKSDLAPNDEAPAINAGDHSATNGATRLPGPRVKFQGVVEAQAEPAPPQDELRAGGAPSKSKPSEIRAVPIDRPRRNWNARSRQVLQATRMAAILFFFAVVGGWPVGAYLFHWNRFGSSEGWFGTLMVTLSPSLLVLAIFVPILIVLCGYLLSHAYKILSNSEKIARAAREFLDPDQAAAANANSVGLAVRGQLDVLNSGVDDALKRLARAEAMIRNHVEAIERAGAAIEYRATGAVDKVAVERSRLIDLTENLNKQADAFAAAIAERAQANVEAVNSTNALSSEAERRLEDRLARLEAASHRALQSFDALRTAISGADETVNASAASLEEAAARTQSASDEAAKASLEAAAKLTETAKAVDDASVETAQALKGAADSAIDATKQAASGIAEAALNAAKETTEDVRSVIDTAQESAAKAKETAQDIIKAADETASAADAAAANIIEAGEKTRALSEKTMAESRANADQIEERNRALAAARAALEEENARLEALIEEQRSRANRLADAIAAQTDRLSKIAEDQLNDANAEPPHAAANADHDLNEHLASNDSASTAAPVSEQSPAMQEHAPVQTETAPIPGADAQEGPDQPGVHEPSAPEPASNEAASKDKGAVSWREILSATDEAEPLELNQPAAAPAAHNASSEEAIKVIAALQLFTRDLEERLYGDPPPALAERFDAGDRNVFANRILRLNEADVKRRIRQESARDKNFEAGIHGFLQGFERLLEDATTSETADEELEQYLSSPLGRVYLLIGATVGYFA